MTLSPVGKSRRRRAALAAIAILIVLVAAGGTELAPRAAADKPEPDTGTVQFHKYLPKDNVNTPWQNEAQVSFTFKIYSDADLSPGHLVATGDQLGQPIGGIPQADIWITEEPVAGYSPAGFFVPDGDGDSGNDKCNQQPADGSTLSPSPLHVPAASWTTKGNHTGLLHICAYNKPSTPSLGWLTVNKVLVPSNDPGLFNLQIDGLTKAYKVGDGGTTGAVGVQPGPYVVSETADAATTNLADYTSIITGDCDSAGNVTVAAGESKTCTITNIRNQVGADNKLFVKKIGVGADGVSGPFTGTASGPTNGLAGWSLHKSGSALYAGLPVGAYVVTEHDPTALGHTLLGYKVIELASATAPLSCPEPGGAYLSSGDVTIAETEGGETWLVCVYNQYDPQLGTLMVTKTTLTNGAPDGNNDGWAITASSATCGVTYGPVSTLGGAVTFSNIPACSDYVVSENATNTLGYAPAGPTSLSGVVVVPNATTTVGFSNERSFFIPVCVENCEPPVIPTPTATIPPPTATSTPVEAVLGEKTPGPGIISTPIAPSAGTGQSSGGGSVSAGVALLGLFATSASLAVMAIGRKRNR